MHPLDPLAAGEIKAAAEIIRRDRATADSWRFASLDLGRAGQGRHAGRSGTDAAAPGGFFDRNPALDLAG